MDESAKAAASAELHDLPGHLLWRARARVAAAAGEVLGRPTDLHAAAALLALAHREPQSQEGLARACGVSSTTMTSVLGPLRRAGLVTKVRNPDDRRSYALGLTETGVAAAGDRRVDVDLLEDRLTAGLGQRGTSRLRGLLLVLVAPEVEPGTAPVLLERVCLLLVRAHQRVHRDFAATLRPLGLEPRDVGALRVLRVAPGITQGELARLLQVSPATVVQVVDHLQEGGLVARGRHPGDRRAHRLFLRPGAEAVLSEAAGLSVAVVERPLGGPSASDRADLVRLLGAFLAGGDGQRAPASASQAASAVASASS